MVPGQLPEPLPFNLPCLAVLLEPSRREGIAQTVPKRRRKGVEGEDIDVCEWPLQLGADDVASRAMASPSSLSNCKYAFLPRDIAATM